MGCRLQVLTVCKIQMEVGAPNADFTLFIVGTGNADFALKFVRAQLSKNGRTSADGLPTLL